MVRSGVLASLHGRAVTGCQAPPPCAVAGAGQPAGAGQLPAGVVRIATGGPGGLPPGLPPTPGSAGAIAGVGF